ncbi:MAG: hypothetical protein Q7J10_05170, partial [Methanosarcinaceae archaeon]|nr:hypothetical protein [Methanosarcinaceae archaeon]
IPINMAILAIFTKYCFSVYCGINTYTSGDYYTAVDTINILQKVGQGMPEFTPVEMFVGTSVKQEAAVL